MPATPRATALKIGGFALHASLTPARVTDAARRQMFGTDNPGFCPACGTEAAGCEPDARRYPCERCGKRAVYGAQEILIHLVP